MTHKNALVLLCLAYLGYGRRAQMSRRIERSDAKKPSQVNQQVDPLKDLAMFVLAANPATAFNLCLQGFRFHASPVPKRLNCFGHRVSAVGMDDAQPKVFETIDTNDTNYDLMEALNLEILEEEESDDQVDDFMPQEGDIVRMPSRWPMEWDVGQVDRIQELKAQGTFEVDVIPLEDYGNKMWRLPKKEPEKLRLPNTQLALLDYSYDEVWEAWIIEPKDLVRPYTYPETPKSKTWAELFDEVYTYASEGATQVQVVGTLLAFLAFGGKLACCFFIGTIFGQTYLGASRLPLSIVGLFLLSRGLGIDFSEFLVLSKEQLAAGFVGFLANLGLLAYNANKPLDIKVDKKNITEAEDA
mmetsp:Transcript_111812/g.193855  ORF Transcript_111812/g.193855 Transcript_111812/m.193855 type:complete len:356 (-) Transcript_111812:23-1090(-)